MNTNGIKCLGQSAAIWQSREGPHLVDIRVAGVIGRGPSGEERNAVKCVDITANSIPSTKIVSLNALRSVATVACVMRRLRCLVRPHG